MARHLSVFSAFIIVAALLLSFVECVSVIVGDKFTFPGADRCPIDKRAELVKDTKERGEGPVAVREPGQAWNPAEGYEDQMEPNSPPAFKHSLYTHTGVYRLKCDDEEERISLDVVVAYDASLTGGERGKLVCFFTGATIARADSLRWEKDGEVVLTVDLTTGVITNEAGEGNVSLVPDGHTTGEWSLIIHKVHMGHEGRYFCSAFRNGVRVARGRPAAARVTVTRKSPSPSAPFIVNGSTADGQSKRNCTDETHGGTWTVLITAAVTSGLTLGFVWLVRYLKSRCPRGSYGSEGAPPSDEGQGNREPLLHSNCFTEVNVVNGGTNSLHAEAEV